MKNLLCEANGQLSSMRVAAFVVLIAVVLPPFWYALANNQPEMKLDWQNVGLLLGMFGAKAVQRANEQPTKP